jgi:transcriptional regulator of aromatic amino acid metabolism
MRVSPAASNSLAADTSARSVVSLPQVRSVDPVDLNLIISGGSNALLCGPLPVLNAALSALQPHLGTPIQKSSGSDFSLPRISAGTLILEQVANCSAFEQEALLVWLDAIARQVQVIATADLCLFDLVERGRFSDRLYYRLNTVHLDLQLPSA